MKTLFTALVTAWAVTAASLTGCTSEPLPACTVEDSSHVYPCLWDASERGNGRDFIMYSPDHWTYVTKEA